MRKTVAFGFVGTVLDYAGRGSQRVMTPTY